MNGPADIPQLAAEPEDVSVDPLGSLPLFQAPPVHTPAPGPAPEPASASVRGGGPTVPAEGGRRAEQLRDVWAAAAAAARPRVDNHSRDEVLTLTTDNDFWATVTELRSTVAERMTTQRFERGSAAERGAGIAVIDAVVRDASEKLMQAQGNGWPTARQRALKKALVDAHFGLGRLQALVDDPTVENIEVYGPHDTVAVRVDGSTEQVGSIARNETELRSMVNDWAAAQRRSFTANRPRVRLALPGKARLTAVGFGHTIDERTEIFIRMQRLRDVTIEGLQNEGEVDSVLKDFLTAAVRARNTVVISGAGQGSGKSSLLRALALAGIPHYEKITTVETEFELYLNEYRQRVSPWQPITEAGELDVDPEVAIRDLLYDVQRSGADRVIVGEARGWEVMAMVRAMLSGHGSMTTIHADNAALVIEALVTLIAQYSNATVEQARLIVARLVHLIVYIDVDIDPRTGRRFRYVTEVLEVTLGDAGQEVATNRVFKPGPDGRAVPVGGVSEQLEKDLRRGGFDPMTLIEYRDVGTWGPRP